MFGGIFLGWPLLLTLDVSQFVRNLREKVEHWVIFSKYLSWLMHNRKLEDWFYEFPRYVRDLLMIGAHC